MNNSNNGNLINPIASAVTGAVVGAGLAVVATQALKNKNTKKKVKEVVIAAKDQVGEYIKSHKNELDLNKEKGQLKKTINNKSKK